MNYVKSAKEAESGQDGKTALVTPHESRKGFRAGLRVASRRGPDQRAIGGPTQILFLILH